MRRAEERETHLINYRLQVIRTPFVFETISNCLYWFWLVTHDRPRSPSAEYVCPFSFWNTVPSLDMLGVIRKRQKGACDIVER